MDEVKFTHEESEYKVVRPSNKIRKESDAIYAKAYRKAIADGLFLEAEIDNIIKDRGLKAYNEKERKDIEKEIRDLEVRFNNNVFHSVSEGFVSYDRIVSLRKSLEDLDKAKRELSTQSANISAENERFSYFVSACSLTADDEKIWDNMNEYKDDMSELANKFATEMIHIIYDGTQALLSELEKIRPENIWFRDQSPKSPKMNVVSNESSIEDKIEPKKQKRSKKATLLEQK